jgi:Aspartyl/Asparaginyl beta-hydroxylase
VGPVPGPLTAGDAGSVLRAIAAADAHLPGIRCLRLLEVEPSAFGELREEVLRLCESERPSRVTRPGHVTNWTGPYGDVLQYSLLSRSSRYDDYSGDHDLSCFGRRFRDERSYPRLAELIRLFPHAVNFRVNVLGPGAGLSAHEEHALFRTDDGGLGIRARLHLPVETNPAAELVLDGDVHSLEPRSVYFVNHGCVHWAGNGGDAPRVHLVWDVLLTREAFALLFGTAATGTPLLTRVRAHARECVPGRRVPVEDVRRLAPLVPPGERASPALCEPQ